MSRLLSIDQSSRVSGYAVFVDGKLSDYGKFSFDDSDTGQRLFKIRQTVKSLINQYFIEEVVFEEIQLQQNKINNVVTYKVLAEVYGIIEELLTELKIPYTTVSASAWKSTLGIKGKDRPAQKRNAQVYVKETYKVDAIQDIVDAICIGTHYLQHQDFDWS